MAVRTAPCTSAGRKQVDEQAAVHETAQSNLGTGTASEQSLIVCSLPDSILAEHVISPRRWRRQRVPSQKAVAAAQGHVIEKSLVRPRGSADKHEAGRKPCSLAEVVARLQDIRSTPEDPPTPTQKPGDNADRAGNDDSSPTSMPSHINDLAESEGETVDPCQDEEGAAKALASLTQAISEEDELILSIYKDVPTQLYTPKKRASNRKKGSSSRKKQCITHKKPPSTRTQKAHCWIVAKTIWGIAQQLAIQPGMGMLSSNQSRITMAWEIWKYQHADEEEDLEKEESDGDEF